MPKCTHTESAPLTRLKKCVHVRFLIFLLKNAAGGLTCHCSDRTFPWCVIGERTRVCGEGELCALEFDRYRSETPGDPNPRQMCSGALPEGACSGALNSETRFIACCNYSRCNILEKFEPVYLAPTTTATPSFTVIGTDTKSIGNTGAGVYGCLCVQRERVRERERGGGGERGRESMRISNLSASACITLYVC